MKYVRKFFLLILSSILVTLLVGTAASWTMRSTLANRDMVKNWLLVSGVYDNFVDEVVAASSEAASENPDIATIDQEIMINAARAAFPPATLQDSLETVLDGSYNWLEGSSQDLHFVVDFTDEKQLFASELALAVKIKADALPTCALNEIPETLDIFAATCLPAVTSSRVIADEFEASILNNDELLADPVITADNILVNTNSEQLPIDEAYPEIALWYQRALWLPAALTALSTMVVIGVVFLSDTRRKGIFHLAKAFAFAAFSTGITAFIASVTPLDTSGIGGGDGPTDGFSERILIPFVQEAIDSIAFWAVQFTVLYAALTLSFLVYLLLTHYNNQKKAVPAPTPELEQQVQLPPARQK